MKKRTLLIFALTTFASSNFFAQTITSFDQNSADRQGVGSTYLGYKSGIINQTGNLNTFVGAYTGEKNTTGFYNTFLGTSSGRSNTTGARNVFVGNGSGRVNTTGSFNVFLGENAGRSHTTGWGNISIGVNSAYYKTSGNYNVFLGMNSGQQNVSGERNVFLGFQAGYSETRSNTLYIENSNSTTPLIYGDFANDQLVFNGKVSTGLGNNSFPTVTSGGTNISDYTLFVKGGLLSEEIRVLTGWADYVFEDSYSLKSLNEVENFINTNGHLPNIPSAKEVELSGIEMGEITKLQQEKIEELTLYTIQQQKEIDQQQNEINTLKELVNSVLASQKQ